MKARKTFSPAAIDSLNKGKLADPQTIGLFVAAMPSGRKSWIYRRRLVSSDIVVERRFGQYPVHSIADAREWAAGINEKVEAGIDPRIVEREQLDCVNFSVARAHELYIAAVREGRASRAKKLNKPRTITDKLNIYEADIAPKLAAKVIFDVSEADLVKLVLAKGKTAKVRANRLAAELKVFFGWAASLRGLEIGLKSNPATRLADLKFAEASRKRILSIEEIGWFLKAVALESRTYQRGMLLWLLTAARISEVINAKFDECSDGIWTIPGARVKNSTAHQIALGPWGWSLVQTNNIWLFPSARVDGPQAPCGWYKARNRVLARMSECAGRPIEKWTPHDLRRTARSNTKRLKVDFETAEAMLNHTKQGLERIYDGYHLEDEKRDWFLKWEKEIIRIACSVEVADALGVPASPHAPCIVQSVGAIGSPESSTLHPGQHIGKFEPGATPVFAATATQFILPRKTLWSACPQPIDLPT